MFRFLCVVRQRTLQTLIDVHRRHSGTNVTQAATSSLSLHPCLMVPVCPSPVFWPIRPHRPPSQAMVREEEMQWLQEALNGMTSDREVLALRTFRTTWKLSGCRNPRNHPHSRQQPISSRLPHV